MEGDTAVLLCLVYSTLLGVLSSYTNGHLVLINGNHVKQLTPAEPHEVEAFIHTLQRYAQETLGPRKVREGGISPNNFKHLNATSGRENKSNSVEDERHIGDGNSDPLMMRKNMSEEAWHQMGLGDAVHDSLHSLLKTIGHNSSRPAIFKTNFALTNHQETNY